MMLKTKRLYMREMERADWNALARILQDETTMYYYNGAFADDEVTQWMERQLRRYREYDHAYGMWAVVLAGTREMIGQCGLTLQPWKDRQVLEIGYLFRREYWHQGLAIEAARSCKEYAFETLHAQAVHSIIRDTNIPSQKVAMRNGMTPVDQWVKHYRGVDMPHHLYRINKEEYEKGK